MMFYDEHNPPHFHAEFHSKKALFDFLGNILVGDLGSNTAVKLVREGLTSESLNLKTTGNSQWRERKSRRLIL